jgi:hypothetical protein
MGCHPSETPDSVESRRDKMGLSHLLDFRRLRRLIRECCEFAEPWHVRLLSQLCEKLLANCTCEQYICDIFVLP